MDEPKSVEEYLGALPVEQRDCLERLREIIREAAPEASEAIAWQMPAFKDHGRALVGYAAFKDHCSFFPMSVAVMEMFADELEPFSTSKGTIRFTVDRPLPKALVRKIVKARLAEAEARRAR